MAQAGDLIFVTMWPVRGHYEPKTQHAKLPDAQAAIKAQYPECLHGHFFWNDDGRYCRLLANTPFPHELPFVVRKELT
jgi:hypothetical protein